jgi:hypothetical protein
VEKLCQGGDGPLQSVVTAYRLPLVVGSKDAKLEARNSKVLRLALVEALKQELLEVSEVDATTLYTAEDWEGDNFVPWLATPEGEQKLKDAVARQRRDNVLDWLAKSPEKGGAKSPTVVPPAPLLTAMLGGSATKVKAALAANVASAQSATRSTTFPVSSLLGSGVDAVKEQLDRQWAAQQAVNDNMRHTMEMLANRIEQMSPVATPKTKKKYAVSSSESESDEDARSVRSGTSSTSGGLQSTKLDSLLGRDLSSREMDHFVASLGRQFGTAGAKAFVISKTAGQKAFESRRLAGHLEGAQGIYAALVDSDVVEAKRLTGLMLKKMSLYITALLDYSNGSTNALNSLRLLDLEGDNRLEETLQMAKLSKTLMLDNGGKKSQKFSGGGAGRGGGGAFKPTGSNKGLGSDAAASGPKP